MSRNITWDADNWLKRFTAPNPDYRGLRREVWENTKAVVESGSYALDDGRVVTLPTQESRESSSFYAEEFKAKFEPLAAPLCVSVVPNDCLDVAHEWVNEGLEVSVLNMANRRNPGGGVHSGAGAQEEYLFRCSDYYKFMYCFAEYAEQYGLKRSSHQYPLDRNYGGVYSPGVMVFRENESKGYRLADSVWQVNMIAVAGMNSPHIVIVDGEECISPGLVDGVKNKIRTIFRIACAHGQRNLVLGAFGCGAFRNPPKHVAELFAEVLCEREFSGAFSRICFAVKSDHNSRGDSNYSAFKEVLHGFVPERVTKARRMPKIIKLTSARYHYAVLTENREVFITDFHTGTTTQSHRFDGCLDIAGGFEHLIGLSGDGRVISKSLGSQAQKFIRLNNREGKAVAACEGHSALLLDDGRVLCEDQYSMDTPGYSAKVNEWRDVKQAALTFDVPFALTNDGRLLRGDGEMTSFYQDGKEIIQIAAFGCYYSQLTLAALYSDGTVRAEYFPSYLWDGPLDALLDEYSSWSDVKKVCCGNHGALAGLTHNGRVLLPQEFPYKDAQGNDVKELEDIIDIHANFDHLIALTRQMEIICLFDR